MQTKNKLQYIWSHIKN